MGSRNLTLFFVIAAFALACGPAVARHGFRPHRPPRFPIPFSPTPVQPPPIFVPQGPVSEPPAPMGLPPLNYGGASPPLPGGMVITITKILSEDAKTLPKSDDAPSSTATISRPRQAAEQIAACWSPPFPPSGDTVEITIRFGFDSRGLVQGSPRITYVKAAPGMSDEAVRDSIGAAIKACTPLHFTAAMAAAVPGYPYSVRFIGRRADENGTRNESRPTP
jgi:hypothetical protein